MALPQNVVNELKSWLTDVTQSWHQIVNGKDSGETGIDIGARGLGKSLDAPIYAITSGKVIGAGYYGGGGVEAVQSNINYGGINGPASIYYQHLDINLLKKGDTVYQGELIGYSGGQLSGGSHPSTRQFSGGSHIEIGINAPYGQANQSIWSPLGKNINPLGFFQALASGNISVLQNGTGAGPDPCSVNPLSMECILSKIAPATANAANTVQQATDIPGAIAALPGNITNSISTAIGNAIKNEESVLGITGPADIGWRILLIIIGFVLMLAAILFIGFDLLDKSNIEVAGTRV